VWELGKVYKPDGQEEKKNRKTNRRRPHYKEMLQKKVRQQQKGRIIKKKIQMFYLTIYTEGKPGGGHMSFKARKIHGAHREIYDKQEGFKMG